MSRARRHVTRTLLRASAALLGLSASAAAQATSPDRFEPEILAFEAADAQSPPARGGIVFTGSSTIRLWPDLPAAFPDLPVLQRGFGGATMAEVLRYADRVVVRYEPRIVVIFVGGNDLAEGSTPEDVRELFGTLVEKIHHDLPDAHVCYISINPTLARRHLQPSVDRANGLLAELVAERPWTTFIDSASSMRGLDGEPRLELLGEDGLHLNAAGYRVLVSVVRPPLERLFVRTTTAPDDPCRELRQARSRIRAGDLPSAQRSLETCVGASPQNAEGWLTLGLVHFAERHFDQAAAALEKSLELDAAQPEAFKMLGRVHTARSKPALAERAFVEAGRLAPQDAEPRYLLGRLYQSEGRLVEAARFLKEAAALDPGSVRALAFLGTVSYGLGDTSLTQASFLRAVSLNRAAKAPDAIPHLEYGIYLQRVNRLEESVAELRRAAQLDASSVEARFELAQSLHRLRRLKEANEALREALNLDGTEARVHYLLGRVCYEQGDRGCGDEHMRLSERQRGR